MAYQAVFKIDGKDFTHLLLEGAIGWARNDIDTKKTGRSTLDAKMYRKRMAVKRKLNVTIGKRLSTAEIIELNKALLPETVQITFLDAIEGEVTKTFYGSSVEATTLVVIGDETYWEGTSFSLVEV